MLWAITSYFNPVGYANRLRNYRLFRDSLVPPLAVIELSLNGTYELCQDDADIVVQITGGDVMWQKERLLNLALDHLPRDCNHVAWVDCDVLFLNSGWAEAADRALERLCLIQPFRERCNLSRDVPIFSATNDACDSVSSSVGYKVATGEVQPEDFSHSDAPLTRRSTAGLAWAARRELLQTHRLYDACILGSGDRAILSAAMGMFECGVSAVGMQGPQIEHYLRWAVPFHRAVDGKLGFVDGRVLHLWHGDLKNRRYAQRHAGLSRFAFNPFTDLALHPSGTWRWNGAKPEMHEYVRNYFCSRREDG